MILTENKIYKILVVDDNEKNIQVIGSCLKDADYQLGFANDGFQALSLLEEADDYDLILLDIGMPGLNGFETCKAIRKIDRLNDTPIIFITAFDDFDSIVNGFESGGQDYITKPFNLKELMARVKTQLELKTTKNNLKDVNKWLEQKVEERTMELKLLNEQLEKQADDVLEAYLKLEKVNNELSELDASKTSFLKLISFDICGPLNRLMSFLKSMQDNFELSNNVDIITIIESSAIRLERFSFVTSRLSDLRSRNNELTGEFISVVNFIDFLKEKLQHKVRLGNISVKVDEDTLESVIKGDLVLLQICFGCILDNVYRYSGENSEVKIHISSQNDNVTFNFVNKEPAFIKEVNRNLNKVFTSAKYYSEQNFGLDLALIKIIMDAFKGLISVRNNDSEGAVVSLVLKKF
jgi:two-component system sensor histidine kinase/response regulator